MCLVEFVYGNRWDGMCVMLLFDEFVSVVYVVFCCFGY